MLTELSHLLPTHWGFSRGSCKGLSSRHTSCADLSQAALSLLLNCLVASMAFLRLYKIAKHYLGKKEKSLFLFHAEADVTASHTAALLLQGSLKQGGRRSGSMGIDCLEGKQEVTSLGRFNSSTASYCDRTQHFIRAQRCILTELPRRPYHLHSPCRKLKGQLLIRYLNG